MKSHKTVHNLTSSHNTNRGFTLTEILVAIALIVMVTAIAVTMLKSIFDDSKASIAQQFVRQSLKTPLMHYQLHTGDYPSTADGIRALVQPPVALPNWKGPYLDPAAVPVDPWGVEYRYAYPGKRNPRGPDIWSLGPDRVDGTDDDIGNWPASS